MYLMHTALLAIMIYYLLVLYPGLDYGLVLIYL
jgi:hypothetical protein